MLVDKYEELVYKYRAPDPCVSEDDRMSSLSAFNNIDHSSLFVCQLEAPAPDRMLVK